jgi:hypothetical protein
MAKVIETKDRDRRMKAMSTTACRRKTSLRWATFTAVLAIMVIFSALLPLDSAEAVTTYYFNPASNCDGITYSNTTTVTLTTNNTCNRADKVRITYEGYQDLLIGYLDNGGYIGPYLVTGENANTSDISIKPKNCDGTGYVKLAEIDPSDGSVVSVLSTMTFTINAGVATNLYNIGQLSGEVSHGKTFGIIIGAQTGCKEGTTDQIEVQFGNGATTDQSQWVSVTETINGDGMQVVNAGSDVTAAPQGNKVVMQYFQLQEIDNVAGNPQLDMIKVDDLGTDADNDVESVSIYLSADTALDGGDTLLGTGTFSGSTVTIDITDQTITTTPSDYFLIVYKIKLNADDTHQVQSSLADESYLIPVGNSYVDAFTNLNSNVANIEYTPKDEVTISDEEVWSSGYLEQGITNAPILSYSLQVTSSGIVDDQATLDKVKVDEIGTVTASDIAAVKIYISDDNSFDADTDTLIGSGDYSGGMSVTIDVTDQTITTTKKYIFIVYDISSTATVDNKVQVEIVNDNYVVLSSVDVVNYYAGTKSNSLPIRPQNFKTIGECYECHTFPPMDSPDPATKARNPYSGAVVGDHERVSHVQTTGVASVDCAPCHVVPTTFGHRNGIVNMASNIEGGTYSKGTAFAHVNNPTTGVCSNTSCHGTASPQWGIGTLFCRDCHNQRKPDPTSGPRRKVVGGAGSDMEDSSIVSRHIHNTTSYADSSCEVCHLRSNHTRESDPNVLLYNGDTGEQVPYDGTGASVTPACVSCHDSDGVTRLGQNALKPFFASGDTNAPANIGWKPGQSAHDVAANLATDKCLGCHGNAGGTEGDTLNPKKNAHGSTQEKLLKYTYDTNNSQTFCYSCHDGSGASRDIQAAFNLPFNHTAGRQSCVLCHDPHQAEEGLHVPGQGGIANVNKGPGWNYEYEICFTSGCHDTAQIKTNTASEKEIDSIYGGTIYQDNWSTIPDIQSQFSTTNYAYHPLLAQGRNQPPNDANPEWASHAYRKNNATGLDHTFVDGWGTASLVTCTDCHDNAGAGASGARGPHGSANPWILKGIDTSVTVDTASGQLTPNSGADTTKNWIKRNLCINCHRADVYGWGDNTGPAENSQDLSRMSHRGGGARTDCLEPHETGGKGGYAFTGCLNCHGGGEVAGIHGSSLGDQGLGAGNEMGKRFMNGNSWAKHKLGDDDGAITCYTGTPPAIGVSMSSCDQHSGGKNITINYTYPWE